jgi:hypothetical protein
MSGLWVNTSRGAKCQGCGRTIEKGEQKAVLYQYQHNKSICGQCVAEINRLLIEANRTTPNITAGYGIQGR